MPEQVEDSNGNVYIVDKIDAEEIKVHSKDLSSPIVHLHLYGGIWRFDNDEIAIFTSEKPNAAYWEAKVRKEYPKWIDCREPNESWQHFAQILPYLDHGKCSTGCLQRHLDVIANRRFKYILKYPQEFSKIQSYSAQKGYNDVYLWCLSLGNPPRHEDTYNAASGGHILILNIIEQTGFKVSNKELIFYAIRNGRLNVLQWLAERGVFPKKENANNAAEYGFVEILDWSEQNNYALPDQEGISRALLKGKTKVVQWGAKRGIYPSNQAEVERACQIGDLDKLKELYAKTKLTSYTYDACRYGHISILDWLETLGILPDSDDVEVAKDDQTRAWLSARGIEEEFCYCDF